MATKFLNISTDNSLGGNSPSDEIVSSQKAIKGYVDSHTGGNAIWGNITGTLSNQTDLQNALNAKQDTSGLGSAAYTSSSDYATSAQGGKADTAVQPGDLENYVTTDTTQTISGTKTFREGRIIVKNPAVDNEVAPSSNQYISSMNIIDKNNKTMGLLSFTKDTNGYNHVYLYANGQNNSSTTYTSYIELGCKKDGTSPWVSTMTPATSDNSTRIATTAWCHGHGILIASQMPTSSNNYTWYRKYSDGWVEQGGQVPAEVVNTTGTVNLPIAMSDANYFATIDWVDATAGNGFVERVRTRTTTNFGYATDYWHATGQSLPKVWLVIGKAA